LQDIASDDLALALPTTEYHVGKSWQGITKHPWAVTASSLA
jgi:hypothetical protein